MSTGAPFLRAAFVRVPGQRDRIYVHRRDGTETSWVFPTYGDNLPHDLIHLVVESAFGLRHGFWGRVDASMDPARINAEANRAGGADKYRGFGEDRRELLFAEALANAGWYDPLVSNEARRASMLEGAAGAGIAPPVAITAERVAATHAALEQLRGRWRAFGALPKGTLELHFFPDDPERGFTELLAALRQAAPG
ncbi:hypothetical protein ACMHYB_52415 [Sorangium sp. So ce1128]